MSDINNRLFRNDRRSAPKRHDIDALENYYNDLIIDEYHQVEEEHHLQSLSDNQLDLITTDWEI